jgi:eukaryotic-like serine/threonine-protein kinase
MTGDAPETPRESSPGDLTDPATNADGTPPEQSQPDEETLPPRVVGPAPAGSTVSENLTTPDHADEATLPPRASEFPSGSDPNATLLEPDARIPSVVTHVPYFGEYELLHEIARGGMGVVYKAKQIKLNRIVALKMILSRQLASQEEVDRFYIEAEAAAKLEHPGIVPIFEIGEHEGQHFFSMGFVEGQSLADRLKEGPMPPRQAASVTKQVVEAIAFAHENGVIHRDLKPANVLIDGSGLAKVTDFGLAKQTDGDGELTGTGQILGTPGYMPPEQAAGDTKHIGPAADIYSLGALLYALLTGHAPFQAASVMDTLVQVLENEPVSPRALNSALDQDLETICLKCLEKDASRRYGTADELVAELERFLAGEPIIARPISGTARVWRWCKRNPLIASLSVATAVLLLIGITVASGLSVWALNEKEAADLAKETAIGEADNAQRSRKTAERIAYTSDMLLAKSDWDNGGIPRLTESLNRYHGNSLRSFEWYYWDRLVRSGVATPIAAKNPILSANCVAFSPDGTRLAVTIVNPLGGPNGEIKLWDVATMQEKFTIESGNAFFVSFSPDGSRLASSNRDNTVRVWDAKSGEAVMTLKGHASPVLSLDFSPDGTRLATVGGYQDNTVKVWDLATEKAKLTLKGSTAGLTAVSFSPDGSRLASSDRDKTVRVWDAESGEAIMTLKGHVASVFSLDYSPDGTRLATAAGGYQGNTVKVWDLATEKATITIREHEGPVSSVKFSPDGRRLATGSHDQMVKLWDAATGRETLTLKGHTSVVTSVAFNPTGTQLASTSTDKTVKLWDATMDPESLEFEAHSETVTSVSFSPNGKQLASAGGYGANGDNTVTLWDAAAGQRLPTLNGQTGPVHHLSFSPSGERIATARGDGTVKVWNVAERKELLTLNGHTAKVSSVAFSSNGERLASAYLDGTVKVWNLAIGEEMLTFEGHGTNCQNVLFCPDGEHIVSAGSGVKLWDASTGQEKLTLKNQKAIYRGMALSSDGTRMAAASGGSWDPAVQVWDTATGEVTLTIKGHAGVIESVAFSPDGMRLATASTDRTVKLWDATTGRETLTLNLGSADLGGCVSFAPGGMRLATCNSEEKIVKVWDARPWTAELRAQSRARGYLTVHRERSESLDDLQTYIRSDKTISDMVRNQALDWAELFWKNRQPERE